MNILLITDDFYPNLGGVANVLWNLYKSFQNTEHRLFIFNPYYRRENIYKVLINRDYRLKDLANFLRKKKFCNYLIYSFWNVIRDKKTPFSHRLKILLYFITKPNILIKVIENICHIYPYLQKLDYDIIVGGNSGWIFSLVFLISRIFNKKLISMAYGNDFLVRNPLSLKTYFFRNADKIIVINNQMRDIIKKMHHLHERQLKTIYIGIDLKDLDVKKSRGELREEFNVPKNQFILLSVGRHVPRKNFDLVIKVVSKIKKIRQSLNLKYFLIGEGQETFNLKNLARKLDIEDHIEFLGSCDSETRNKFYKLSDIFVMPSKTKINDIEGFGIVFIEANYYKVPVIGTKTGGIIEAIKDCETGLLVKPNNLNDLTEKVLFLHDNPAIRKKLGEAGHKRAINEFSWEKIVGDYIRVFKNTLKS